VGGQVDPQRQCARAHQHMQEVPAKIRLEFSLLVVYTMLSNYLNLFRKKYDLQAEKKNTFF
jgi:hypothetical protein